MNEIEPVVSVIVPTYRRPVAVRKAVESALSQSYKKIEILVIDDNGMDSEYHKETKEALADKIADSRIIYIAHETNKGGNAARNTGLKSSRGEVVAFLDDDDLWKPEIVEEVVRKFKDSKFKNLGMIYVWSITYCKDGKRIYANNCIKGNIFKKLLFSHCLGGSPGFFYKRHVFTKTGDFDEALPAMQDYDMVLRVARKFEIDCVPKYLFEISEEGERVSNNYQKLIKSERMFIDKHLNSLSSADAKILMAGSHFRLGYHDLFLDKDSNNIFKIYFRKAFLCNPFNKYVFFYFILSHFFTKSELIRFYGFLKRVF